MYFGPTSWGPLAVYGRKGSLHQGRRELDEVERSFPVFFLPPFSVNENDEVFSVYFSKSAVCFDLAVSVSFNS